MSTNGQITVKIDGKNMTLSATQVANIRAQMQTEQQRASDEARPRLVKALEGCNAIIKLSQAGNTMCQITLPNNIKANGNVIYFMIDKAIGTASKCYIMLKQEFPNALDQLADKEPSEIDKESKELAISNKIAKAEAKRRY